MEKEWIHCIKKLKQGGWRLTKWACNMQSRICFNTSTTLRSLGKPIRQFYSLLKTFCWFSFCNIRLLVECYTSTLRKFNRRRSKWYLTRLPFPTSTFFPSSCDLAIFPGEDVLPGETLHREASKWVSSRQGERKSVLKEGWWYLSHLLTIVHCKEVHLQARTEKTPKWPHMFQPVQRGRRPGSWLAHTYSKRTITMSRTRVWWDFFSESSRKHHQDVVHLNEKPAKDRLPCPEPGCNATLKTMAALARHQEIEHQTLFKVYCLKCGKNFTRTGSLTIHMEMHSENKVKFDARNAERPCESSESERPYDNAR